jgi:hypothetical protein
MLKPARLARQQLEVVVELRAGAEAAVQPLVARDLPAAVTDRDLARADTRADPQPGQGDRDRVTGRIVTNDF